MLKRKVVPGFEPGLFGSKPKVITTTLYNRIWEKCENNDCSPILLHVSESDSCICKFGRIIVDITAVER